MMAILEEHYLKGYDLTSKIEKIYNKKPIVIRKNSKKSKILKKLSLENVDQAPIVRNKKLIGIFSRNNFISENLNTPVVIMCGGFGKRLKPITKKIPKAMITINNQPMLSLVISNIRRFGFKKFIFSTYYKGNLTKNYFKNGSSFDLNIDYTNEKKPLGTAGSLSLLRNKIKNEKNLLVTNCDIMSQINYKSLLDFHNENKADLTIAIKKFTSEESIW